MAPNAQVEVDANAAPEVDRITKDLDDLHPAELDSILTAEEKRFMLYVERGDVASVKHVVKKGKKENRRKKGTFNLNCMDPLGRSGLAVAVENENIDMVTVLLEEGIEPTDSLLFAIAEEYVEGVEVLLEHEEKIHKPGEPYSWERTTGVKAQYTSDITPLILAAHKDNYEILRLLLDRGATLPSPHDVKCACDECMISTADDSLRHSLSRINAYKALTSPSLICLSSPDPIKTAFTLSVELGKLEFIEKEFSVEYQELNKKVQQFSTDIVENTRTCLELEIILNYDPEGPMYVQGEHMHLTLLRDAVEFNQKQYVAHANVQQLLASVWFNGLPGFRRKGTFGQIAEGLKTASMFPLYCLAFIFAPNSAKGKAMKQPIFKFICGSASYLFFLFLLVMVSLQVEKVLIPLFGTEAMKAWLKKQEREARGAFPNIVECAVIIYICGFIWDEIKSLWEGGLETYVKDLWNIIDYITNFFFVNWILLRATAWFQVHRELSAGLNPYVAKEFWHPFDPMLIAEGCFGAANVFSFLKLVHVFSVNPHLGPLQISLGRMVFDILKFFFLYTLVLFAFGCGLNNLLWYYCDIDKELCYSMPGGLMDPDSEHSCAVWRRFINLFETSQTLFWASFGLIELFNFELTGCKEFTRFWALLMFGSYSVINVVVLLNLLIAMMSSSYGAIIEHSDVEWKFARAKLWMQYFEDGGEVPPPFNLIPNFGAMCSKEDKDKKRASFKKRQDDLREAQYKGIMRNLVRRFITKQQQKVDDNEINEDDVNEIKQDINSFKYELLNVLKINGYKTGTAHQKDEGAMGRKQQAKERRLMKGFNIGTVEGLEGATDAQNKAINKVANILGGFMGKRRKSNEKGALKRRPSELIGSKTTQVRRQSLRDSKRKKTPWNKVIFYHRRGVFMGGEINAKVLDNARIKSQPELRTEMRGWRKVQRLKDQGKVKFSNETLAAEEKKNKFDPNKKPEKVNYRPLSVKKPPVAAATTMVPKNMAKEEPTVKVAEAKKQFNNEPIRGRLNPAFSMEDELKQATRGGVRDRVGAFENNAFQDKSKNDRQGPKYEVVKRGKSPLKDRWNPNQQQENEIPKLQPPPSRLKLSSGPTNQPQSRSREPSPKPPTPSPTSPVKTAPPPKITSPVKTAPPPSAKATPAPPTPKDDPAKPANVSTLGAGWI